MALCGWRCQRQFSCQSRRCAALGQSGTCSAPGFIWDLGSGLPLRPVGWVVAVLFRGPHMHRGKRKGLVLTQNFRVTFSSSPFLPSPLPFQSTESPFLSSLDQKDGVPIRVSVTQNTATRKKRRGKPGSSLPCRFLFSKSWFPLLLCWFLTVPGCFLFVFHHEWRWAGVGLRCQRWTRTLSPWLWRVSWGVTSSRKPLLTLLLVSGLF